MKKILLFVLIFGIMATTAFAGDLDDAALYYSFDDADLTGSNPDDLSANGYDGTNNGATTGITGILNQAFSYDGTNDQVAFPNLNGVSVNSISFWIRPDVTSSNTAMMPFIFNNGAASEWLALRNSGSQNFHFRKNSNGGNLNFIGSTFQVPTGSWTHLALVYDNATNRVLVYKNASLIQNFTGSGTQSNLFGSLGSTGYFGLNDLNTVYFNGDSDEFTMYDFPLTGAQVSDLMAENPYDAPSANPYFKIEGYNVSGDSTLSNISVVLGNGTTYTNATGLTITTGINDSSVHNFTIFKPHHPLNISVLNWNTTDDYTFNYTELTIDTRDLLNNVSLSPFDIELNYTEDNLSYSYSFLNITNQTAIFSNQNRNLTITGSFPAYFDKQTNLTTSGFSQFLRQYLRPFGSIDVNVYDINTSALMNQSVTLFVQNDTTQVEYAVVNGEGAVVGLNSGVTYTFQLYSAGYSTNTFTLTYNNESEIDFYMQQGQTDITFAVKNTATDPLEDAKVSIEAFVGGVYVVISEGFTDVVGEYISNLETGVTHRISISKDGYTTKTFTTQLLSLSYEVILEESTIFDVTRGQDVITTSYYPKSTNLSTTSYTFEANITSTGSNIEYAYIKLWYNGTNLATDNLTSNSGGTLNLMYNVSAFNESGIPFIFERGYKLSNSTDFTRLFHSYSVTSSKTYTGSLLELRERMAVKLTLGEKVGLYAIVLIVMMILMSVFVQGLVNVVVSSGFALLAGWIFGLSLIILGVFFLVSVVIMMAFSERGNGI